MKDFNVDGEKWPERVVKWPFLSLKFSSFFLQNCKKREIIFIMFFVLAFDPIRFLICYTPQNDHLSIIFVKEIHAVSEKMTRNGSEIVILKYGSIFIASEVTYLGKTKKTLKIQFSDFLYT